ncbi:MAG: hypothetical protein AAGK78_05920 [Planctomycetota bacterium]
MSNLSTFASATFTRLFDLANGPATADPLDGFADKAAAAKDAQLRFDAVATRRPEAFEVSTVLRNRDRLLSETSLRNAERNLAFASEAGSVVRAVSDQVETLQKLVQDVADYTGSDRDVKAAAAQVQIDAVLESIDRLATTQFAGRDIFGDSDLKTVFALHRVLDDDNGLFVGNDGYLNLGEANFTNAQYFSTNPQVTVTGEHAVELGGDTLQYVALPEQHTISADTYLEFEFRGDPLAAFEGVVLDNDNNYFNDITRVFQTGGIGSFGTNLGNDGSGNFNSYRIRVADHLAVGTTFDRIGFARDDNANISRTSEFRNIRIVEGNSPEQFGAPTATATGDRHFTNDTNASSRGVDLKLGSLETTDLGNFTVSLRDLATGGAANLIDAETTGDFSPLLDAIDYVASSLTLQQGALDGFARGIEAEAAIGLGTLEQLAERSDRATQLLEAEQAAETARLQLHEEGLAAATQIEFELRSQLVNLFAVHASSNR